MTKMHETPAEAKPVGCTCHPDDRPIWCAGKHALHDCQRAYLAKHAGAFQQGAAKLFNEGPKHDMWFFELFHFLREVKSHLDSY